MIRIYPDTSVSHPVGADIVYKCERCGSILPSILETDYLECACGNLSLDKAADRFAIEDRAMLSYYQTNSNGTSGKARSFFSKLFFRSTQ